MTKLFTFGFWNALAGVILRNRAIIFLVIVGLTVFMGFQWKNMKFSHSEANLLPDDHEINIQYQNFLDKFGEEGNLIVMAVKDSTLFTPEKLKAWNDFNNSFKKYQEIDLVISIADLKKLEKKDNPARFELVPLIKDSTYTKKQVSDYENELFNNLPFYEGLVYSKKSHTVQSALYLKKDIVNTPVRKKFIQNVLQPAVETFEAKHDLDVKVSGMPYIRTLNSQNIMDEISIFILAALLVTSIIFFFFFRSFRATFISMTAVIIGVMWAFGLLGLLEYEITVLTAIIPPLVIVIGIPNCIFLINKYQQEIKKHGNKAKSLQRVITKVGNATLMTNVTTASGFATFALTESKLLKEFGIVASINIIALFILCLLVITIIYSYMPQPKERHLEHLGKKWMEKLVDWMENMVKNRRVTIYFTSVIILIVSIIGIYTIKVSGSLLEDMPKTAGFYQDITFFEKEFDGIMPLEILIDTKRKQGVLKLSTLKRMEQLQELLEETPELSKPISIVSLVKYSKQAFYNGNPKYYQIPTSQERNFILPYAKSFESEAGVMQSYVDSTGRYARITTFMKDIGTDQMDRIEATLSPRLEKIFPKDRYEVSFTGKALIFQKGTQYLVWNLTFSLGLAVILIALFMAWMFRSWKMIVISLIPNLLPLLMTAGLMGYLGVPIKPSTILVFSIAFGISVDDTIHFLAKYRQELKSNHWRIRKSVLSSLRETGVSMFYTSTVLFFGFSVFMISSFGGTKALGGLVSTTLLFAMLANLLLLPSLLLSLERSIANKKTLKEPTLKIIPNEEELEDSEE
ncbi:efflux RND transporter permease subunit [Aquimarina gracilis]|uniref:Efflux RND transporter permease subunit n=1 Tax=Aquimarina gracilis TaxID=874422 RepID=A0ABU5ZQ26_9FLAO|nr:efflux RND transporter permease subunit [Aquimarina gracilis]MEB3344169.1 efflux RND transporter permease subunit [Aquimarina gracilis]